MQYILVLQPAQQSSTNTSNINPKSTNIYIYLFVLVFSGFISVFLFRSFNEVQRYSSLGTDATAGMLMLLLMSLLGWYSFLEVSINVFLEGGKKK